MLFHEYETNIFNETENRVVIQQISLLYEAENLRSIWVSVYCLCVCVYVLRC
jgi:hypothetical protein